MAGNTTSVKKYLKGNVIVQEGDPSKEMHILLQGNVGVYQNYQLASEVQTEVLGQGNFHGEMSLFLNKTQDRTLVALSDVMLLAVTRKTVADFFAKQPDMVFSIIESICRKLDDATSELAKLAPSSPNKIASQKSSLFPEGHGTYSLNLVNNNQEVLYEQKVTCPLCGHSFGHLTIIVSRLRTERTDKDMRVRYKGVEPLHYEIVTCPSCFFSAANDAFQNVSKNFQYDVNQKIGPYRLELCVATGANRDTFTVFAGYYLAILCASTCFDDHQLITANLWLKLGRLYQDCDDQAMSQYAFKKSLGDYLYAYEHLRLPEKQTPQLCFVIGDLYFKLNDLDNSRNYFYNAKASTAASVVMKRQADYRLDEIRELKKTV